METTVKAQSSIHVLERDFADVIGSKKRRVFAEAVYTWQDGTTSTEAESFVPYKHMDLAAADRDFCNRKGWHY